jgi:hypothetical protein
VKETIDAWITATGIETDRLFRCVPAKCEFFQCDGGSRLKNNVVQQQGSGTSAEVRRSYVWMVASVAAISGFLFGFDTAVINGALVFLRSQFGLSNFLTEIAASSLLLGCLIGAAGA